MVIRAAMALIPCRVERDMVQQLPYCERLGRFALGQKLLAGRIDPRTESPCTGVANHVPIEIRHALTPLL